MPLSRFNLDRDYIHMNVGDVLMLCMEDSSVAPVQQLVESLVMIGPESLTLLKEILKEASKRKTQVKQDQEQLMQGLSENLSTFGMTLPIGTDAEAVIRLRSTRFHHLMKKQGILCESTQLQCMQLLQDSRDLLIGLSIKLDLLMRIEEYLEDWTWGLLYLSSKHRITNGLRLH